MTAGSPRPSSKRRWSTVLSREGADVVRIGRGPTPMLYYAAATLGVDGGVMVTGSHNPPDHNGFKFVFQGKSFYGEAIQRLGETAGRLGASRAALGDGSKTASIRDDYVARLARDYHGDRPLTVAWDPGNGATGEVVQQLTARLPGRHVLLNETIDGTFPAHHPDPTIPENLVQLQEAVARERCDLGIAFDGDGDRIGVVDSQGRILWGDQLMVVLARDVLITASGRADPRRRQGEPGTVRRDRAHGRAAGDGGHRAFADQGKARRDRGAARRRNERPHLFCRRLLRVRRRGLCRGAAARHPIALTAQPRRDARPAAGRGQHAGTALRLPGEPQIRGRAARSANACARRAPK